MNYGYFFEQKKTKLYNRGPFDSILLRLYGAVSVDRYLFRAKGDFSVGYQRATRVASFFYMRELFELHGSGKAGSAKPFSLCHERPVRLSDGSEDYRRHAQG